MRLAYSIGFLYLLICGSLLILHSSPSTLAQLPSIRPFSGNGGEWFNKIRPFCNAVEAESRIAQFPAPLSVEGQAYSASCLMLSGNILRARAVLMALPQPDRKRAAEVVFEVAHPTADSGDDNSTRAAMNLVLEFSPDNYMALYHSGTAEYNLRHYDVAKKQLSRFLDLYTVNDGFRQNAQRIVDFLN